MHKKIYEVWEKGNLNFFWGDFFDSRFYIAHLLKNKHSEVLLDIGCGQGILSYFSSSSFKIGVDNSSSSLKNAKELDPKMQLIQCDVRFLPFKNNYFKLILAVQIISAIGNKHNRLLLCNEIKRIAHKKCEIIIAGANRQSKYYKKNNSDEERNSYLHYTELFDFFKQDFKINVEGYGPYSKFIMYPFKIIYKLPDSISKFLKLDEFMYGFLRSKKFLKDGRSYVMMCTRKDLIVKR